MFHHAHAPRFIYPLTPRRTLGCSCLLAVVNGAALDRGAQTSVGLPAFTLGTCAEVGLLGDALVLFHLNRWRNRQAVPTTAALC